MTRHSILAPAKLTLSLRVTGVAETPERFRGYHLIDAVMTTLDLHDVIEIDELPVSSPSRVTYTGKFSDGLDATTGDDLVSRALRAVGRSADVVITKNIPHGGGLGGGSADAAAILRWATTLERRDGDGAGGRPDLDVPEIAVSLGADVVFCASGHRRARVRGIGEIVDPVPEDPGSVTLVVPPFSVGTPAVYRAWDDGPRFATSHGTTMHGTTSHATTPGGLNDLEEPALRVEPRLAEWKARITRASGVQPTLAGSGATWFVLGRHGYLAEQLPEATVIVTRHG